MNRLTNIFNRASVARSDAAAASPASHAPAPAQIVRSKGALNLNLPAPIGKREKAKRMLGAAFSVNAKPIESKAPVKRSATSDTSQITAPLLHAMPSSGSSPLAERFKALKASPTNTPSNIPTRHSEDPSLDAVLAHAEHMQYYNLR